MKLGMWTGDKMRGGGKTISHSRVGTIGEEVVCTPHFQSTWGPSEFACPVLKAITDRDCKRITHKSELKDDWKLMAKL